MKDSNIHCFGFSETWLNENVDTQLLSIPNYSCIRLDRLWSENNVSPKKGGGVCCYIKSGLNFSDSELSQLNKSTKNIEMQWISLNQPYMKKIVLCNLYRPPSGNTETFCEDLFAAYDSLNHMFNHDTDVFILGDFNINYRDPNRTGFNNLKWFEQHSGLTQKIKDITRFSNNNSCIDLIFTNSDEISQCGTLDLNISDHQPIFITRKHKPKIKEKLNFLGRSYLDLDEQTFCTELLDHEWENLYNIKNVDVAWDYYLGIIYEIIDLMCPLKEFNIKNKKDPWITNEMLESIRDKDILLRRAKLSNRDEDWEQARRARNIVNTNIKNLKADFIKTNLNEHQGDSKKFWKDIQNKFPPKNKTNLRKYTLKNNNGEMIFDPKTASNLINDFFTSIGPKLAQTFNRNWLFHGTLIDDQMDNMSVTEEEVILLCKEINTNKSSAIENLSANILKLAFITLSKQLTYVFNLSLGTATVPKSWKNATVTPLFKAGDVSQCNNYRPISVLPLPGKILEKIVHKRLNTFFEANNILNPNQGGFRKNQSTTNTTAKFLDSIYESINNKEFSIATYIDFSKAFDTVPHDILLKKLKLYGVRGKNLKWIKSYLTNRKQKTFFNNVASNYALITCGVPQGSVLGPLLFLIYINDLVDVIENCNTFLYADDTVLVSSARNIHDAHRSMQHDLDNITNWCKSNRLTLNIKKTKSMIFGSKHKIKRIHAPRLQMNDIPLDYVTTYKYLGITADQTLNFNLNLNQIIKTVSYKLSLLSKLKVYISTEAAIQVYKSMVVPYFDYGDILYHCASVKLLDKLQKLQNRGLKICFGQGCELTIHEMHVRSNLALLEHRRVQHVYTFMYKQQTNLDIIDARDIRTRAHDATLYITNRPLCEKYKKNVFYYGARLWNHLPVKERKIDTYVNFKNVQKRKALY